MNPKYPIYVVSKGRWRRCLTVKCLERMGVPYRIVVESQEYAQYANVIDCRKILVLPQSYIDNYDIFADIGQAGTTGPGAARNFCWDHSVQLGAKRHWVLDDNIDDFHRLNRNMKCRVTSGTIFKWVEGWVNRYQNVAIAGFNYYSFAKSTDKLPAFVLNTRVHSCTVIDNSIPYRWRGRYNEDTDLCLRVLKDGYCTVLFNAFLAGKVTTQRMRGGNTDEFYRHEGTLAKSVMLQLMHLGVARCVWKVGRWHHQVDYRPFRQNQLKLRLGVSLRVGVNNYGMVSGVKHSYSSHCVPKICY